MEIDWKKVSKSEGYKSLKAAYIYDVQEEHHRARRRIMTMRNKSEFRRHFKNVIGLAMKYSHYWDIPIDQVLTHWENNRTYWWLNFYNEFRVSQLKPNL